MTSSARGALGGVELQGQVAIITGAGVRVGRALALALADAGANIAVHYNSSADAAEETAAAVRERGVKAVAVQGNLRDAKAAAEQIVEETAAKLGPATILVNNASIFEIGGPLDADEATWDAHFNINLKAPFFLCQAFARRLPEDTPGNIINLLDWRIDRPRADRLVYTLTKSALATMTRGLAHALAPRIRVNGIAPGAILPPPGADQQYLDRLARQIPLERAGSPEEICRAALYLLGSTFVTGEVIYVTGGEHL